MSSLSPSGVPLGCAPKLLKLGKCGVAVLSVRVGRISMMGLIKNLSNGQSIDGIVFSMRPINLMNMICRRKSNEAINR